ncbi:MAG TPA: GNAT family N-acetyltransferase [Planctomycetaceae bacterium]|nr:GNAT family N-acetyltransferase [Planctomycetaceae bacterium]
MIINPNARMIQERDRSGWLDLWTEYLQFCKEDQPFSRSQQVFERFLDPLERIYCVCAELNGAVVGFATYTLYRSTFCSHYGCLLEDLYVTEHSRKKGVGRALLIWVLTNAAENSCDRVIWFTHSNNVAAQRLYASVDSYRNFMAFIHIPHRE